MRVALNYKLFLTRTSVSLFPRDMYLCNYTYKVLVCCCGSDTLQAITSAEKGYNIRAPTANSGYRLIIRYIYEHPDK